VIRFIILAAFVFLFSFLQWLGEIGLPNNEPYTPRVLGTVFLHNRVWYKLEERVDWKITRCVTITFYSEGHCTVSKGE